MEEINLTWSEVAMAANVGVMRRMVALKCNKLGVYGANDEAAWDNDINGAIAEFGAAKWANVFWSGTVGITTLPDVGRWQIRSKVKADHRLVVRPSDGDDDVFVSVFVQIPKVTLCGWLTGIEAKQDKWLKEYAPKPPMYFIDNKFLRAICELRKDAT